MTAPHRTAKERAKLRRYNEDLVRRAPKLSTGAKLLWLELSRWAWDDPVCFPHQDLLELSLGVSRFSIGRWLKELVKHKLVRVKRLRRGNQYRLVEEVPEAVCDPARASNKTLMAMLRAGGHVADLQHEETDEDDVELQIRTSHVADLQHDENCHVADSQHSNVADLQHADDEVHQGEVQERKKRREVGKGKDGESSETTRVSAKVESVDEPGARSARFCEPTADHNKQKTYDGGEMEHNDPSELMADDQPVSVRRNPRQRRAASADLIQPPPGDALSNAGSPLEGTKMDRVGPPPIQTPEDLLALLRGEIEEKYGRGAGKKVPAGVTAKNRGQLRKLVIDQYDPDVVIAMVRLLVWDWEVARSVCFPPYTAKAVPDLDALAQYQSTLVSLIDTGFTYSGSKRGKWVTYASRYLATAPSAPTDDPF